MQGQGDCFQTTCKNYHIFFFENTWEDMILILSCEGSVNTCNQFCLNKEGVNRRTRMSSQVWRRIVPLTDIENNQIF